jgi:hypothetical protein
VLPADPWPLLFPVFSRLIDGLFSVFEPSSPSDGFLSPPAVSRRSGDGACHRIIHEYRPDQAHRRHGFLVSNATSTGLKKID